MSLFDPPTPEELDDAYRLVPGLRRRARLRTRRRRGAALGAVTVIAAVIAVVAISSGSSPPRPVRVIGPSGLSTSVPAHQPPLVIRLSLQRTTAVADGDPIRGELTVINNTGKPIPLDDVCWIAVTSGPGGWIQIGLTNTHVPFEPSWSGTRCGPFAQLPPGVSRYPTMIATVWDMCGGGAPAPRCLKSGLPRLPPGRYITAIGTTILLAGTEMPKAIPVTLIPVHKR